mmetsp:Transcript_37696/g.64309  ORF Transcript_37696/g.64309 Transcript_37696/m.64309 type:complete len:221 (+) Transcript_37696:608-1270(+)
MESCPLNESDFLHKDALSVVARHHEKTAHLHSEQDVHLDVDQYLGFDPPTPFPTFVSLRNHASIRINKFLLLFKQLNGVFIQLHVVRVLLSEKLPCRIILIHLGMRVGIRPPCINSKKTVHAPLARLGCYSINAHDDVKTLNAFLHLVHQSHNKSHFYRLFGKSQIFLSGLFALKFPRQLFLPCDHCPCLMFWPIRECPYLSKLDCRFFPRLLSADSKIC